jgi:tRNA nucleotidyltransferase (CCA-adding enzyme)
MTKEFLFEILISDKPSSLLIKYEDDLFKLIPELKICKGFNQNSDWHIYDVYEHILHVVDNTDNNLSLRLAALFHDIGKPYTYSIDDKGDGHFYNHWSVSVDIFNKFSKKNNIDNSIRLVVSKLIYYHDLNILKADIKTLEEIIDIFSQEDLNLLFNLKRADLLAQNSKYINILNDIDNQEKYIKRLTHSKNML